jgi:transposase InsO family protein
VHRELKENGIECGKNRVARIMKKLGIKSVYRRKFKVCTTDSKHNLPVAENIIAQDFSATAPNQKWGCDISYIHTDEGTQYLAVVLDFFSRKIIGWKMSDTMSAKLCCEALRMAMVRRQPPAELIHHSDRGSQYASFEYRSMLKLGNFSQSMSRKGNCYDNSMVESFFGTLKIERVHRIRYATGKQAQNDIENYIDNFYNLKRRHSSLDYASPIDYEVQYALAA